MVIFTEPPRSGRTPLFGVEWWTGHLVPVNSKLTQITLFISGFLARRSKRVQSLTTARERLHAGSWSGGNDGDDCRLPVSATEPPLHY